MKHLYYFLAFALCMALIFSCRKAEKDLSLYGLWSEEVSAVYDTINHTEITAFMLECEENNYEFSFVRTMYYRKSLDSINYEMASYPEYVGGYYSVENDKMYFKGFYYIDPGYTIYADSTNTQYNYGAYLDTIVYKIDSKCLMFNLDKAESQDIRRFSQQEKYACE